MNPVVVLNRSNMASCVFTPIRFPVVLFATLPYSSESGRYGTSAMTEERAGCSESILLVVAVFGSGSGNRSGFLVVVYM